MEIDSSLLSSEVLRLGHSLYDGVSKDRETDESRSLSAFNIILYDLNDPTLSEEIKNLAASTSKGGYIKV
jgi:hypothetical protein